MSRKGYDTEKEIALSLLECQGVKQKTRFRTYVIDPESVCVNLKLQIAGKAVTENDINLSFKRSSWIVKKFHKLFMLRDAENVAIQSKAYSSRVAFEKVMKDILHALMTRKIGYNLQGNTIVIKEEDGDSLLERKLRHEFRVPVMTEDELGQEYDVIKTVGNNSLSMSKYVNEEWRTKRIKLGELTILDKGHLWWRGLKLANVLRVGLINEEEYERVSNAFRNTIDKLNLERYIYVATKGISPKGQRFLEMINSRVMTIDDLESIISKGRFFKEVKKIDYEPFGIGREVLGGAESTLYDPLDNFIYEQGAHDLMNFDNLTEAVTKFLTKRKRLNY